MKFATVFYCLMPWFITFLACVIPGVPQSIQDLVKIFSLEWIMVSPVMMAVGILVAYRHGQWSKSD